MVTKKTLLQLFLIYGILQVLMIGVSVSAATSSGGTATGTISSSVQMDRNSFTGSAIDAKCSACSNRPLQVSAQKSAQSALTGSTYCPSIGGYRDYEYISDVSYKRMSGSTIIITATIYIANPTKCTNAKPCPEYDSSPEYVNGWIDWNGDGVFSNYERVLDEDLTGYMNIDYRGYMKASRIVTIPANAVSYPVMRVNLGWGYDPNDPCQYSWGWGNVVDKEIHIDTVKVVQLDVSNNIPILDDKGNAIANPVWKKVFDTQGNLIDTTPAENDPIADSIHDFFYITPTIQGYPNDPTFTPRIKGDWHILGANPALGKPFWLNCNLNTNKCDSIPVFTPHKVGKYTLNILYDVLDDKGNIISHGATNTNLYVLYDNPQKLGLTPKTIWLDKAIEWSKATSSISTPEELVSGLSNSIYMKSGWKYEDPKNYFSKPRRVVWYNLVEGKEILGNCVSFSQVWNMLAKVLGISGTTLPMPNRGIYDDGFVTKPATALDGQKGNAHPQYSPVNRWSFGMHQVGLYKSRYYDPTFGKEYSGWYDFVEWHNNGTWGKDATGKVFFWTINAIDSNDVHKVYPMIAPHPAYPWGDFEYHSPYIFQPVSQIGLANFTGTYAESGIDTDGDGSFNYLQLNSQVDVKTTGNYSIFASLKSGDTLISLRESAESSGFSSYYISSGMGVSNVILNFSGQDIYDKGIDGVYTIELNLIDENGNLVDQKSFATRNYNHHQFGEVPAWLMSSNNSPEDTNHDGTYEFLNGDISINVVRPMKFFAEGNLYAQGTLISTTFNNSELHNGTNILQLKFNGTDIEKSKLNGPFNLTVTLYDDNENQIDYQEYSTSAYNYMDFQTPSSFFRNTLSDAGLDTDGDGKYNFLVTEVEVGTIFQGNYSIVGWLSDGNGTITADNVDLFLIPGNQIIPLSFDGIAIYNNGHDGPFNSSIAIYDENGNLVDSQQNSYITSPYKFTDFEKPEGQLVTLTGNYSDYGTDINNDGLYDYLTIEVEFEAANQGYCVASGRLTNVNGTEILWASNSTWAEALVPQRIKLQFDGYYLAQTGPGQSYLLKDVYIYHTGDTALSDYVENATSTKFYSSSLFGLVPLANFKTNQQNGTMPLSVQFTDTSLHAPNQWVWDFGDGNYATVQNPLYLYTETGTYNVSLTATNSAGSNTSVKINYISVSDPITPPIANFSANITFGSNPLPVKFTDESSNFPFAWYWSFGDGNYSSDQNPVHVYTTAGTYNVSLNVINVGGSSTHTKDWYIIVTNISVSNIGVIRNSHDWYLDSNGNGIWDGASIDIKYALGKVGDLPVVGDWNGNGITEIGVFRDNHTWNVDYNGNGVWDGIAGGDRIYITGKPGDVPVPGDWNGDTITEMAVFRGNHTWYIDYNGNGVWDSPAGGDRIYITGKPGDIPVPCDWNGDGITEMSVFRGNHTWYIDYNGNGVWDSPAGGDRIYTTGQPGDLPVFGDWNGDRLCEMGVFRSSNHNFYLDFNGNGLWDGPSVDKRYDFGTYGDIPVSGKW